MTPDLLARFTSIVGPANALTPVDDLTHYTHENRDIYIGITPLVLKPANTEEVSKIVALASETNTPLVPQGGHTGHAGGAVPDDSGEQIVVSLERMNRVREVDMDGNVMIVEAGCILESLQHLADEHDRLFPLALGSQGSCQIGGNISTNAGGTGVLAYGNTRQLVMGLEIVLPSGEIWNGLRRLKKDNTGYDLKDLFIGAEGTLGIVTAAVLKLLPKPKGKSVAFVGLDNAENAVRLLNDALALTGTSLTAFELMGRTPVELTIKHMDTAQNPLTRLYNWHVLIEISSSLSEEDASNMMQSLLETAFETGIIDDAVIASSLDQQTRIWNLREAMPPAQKQVGGSIKHDISIPIHRIPEFLEEAGKVVVSVVPGARPYPFGHLGDGNIHYNVSQPIGMNKEEFFSMASALSSQVNELVVAYDGSISAEHGIGRLKRELLANTKQPIELEMMKAIKKTLDPKNIMNPGKVV